MNISRKKRVKAALEEATRHLKPDNNFNWGMNSNIARAERLAKKSHSKATKAAFEEGLTKISAATLEYAESWIRQGDGFFTNQFNANNNIVIAEQLAEKAPSEAMRTVMRDGLAKIFTAASQQAKPGNCMAALVQSVKRKLDVYQAAMG